MNVNRSIPEADERTRYKRIIRAAEELFKKHGFRGVTMEAVACDAVVAKATLYSYFKHKDALFLAVCTRMAELLERAFAAALRKQDAPLDLRIGDAILGKHRLAFELIRSSPHAEELYSHKAQLAGHVFARMNETMLGLLTEALQGDPALRPHAPRLARALYFGSGDLAARSTGVAEMDADVSAFVATHLAGARALHAVLPQPATRRASARA